MARGALLAVGDAPVYLLAEHTSPEALARVLSTGILGGIPPVSIVAAPWVGPVPTTVSVMLENPMNRSLAGRITVRLPPGWSPARYTAAYRALAPGAAETVSIPVHAIRVDAENRYPLTVATTEDGRTRFTRFNLALWASPRVSANPRLRSTPYPLRLDQRSQVAGIPGWTPQTARAVLETAWSRKALIVDAEVHANRFYQPYSGPAMWQGSSIQLFFQPRRSAHGQLSVGREAGLGLADTPQGPQVYEWNGPRPGIVAGANLTVTRTGSETWRYVAHIPWAALGLTPGPGRTFGFDALLNVVRGHQRVGWLALSPGAGNTNQPDLFPTMTLLASP